MNIPGKYFDLKRKVKNTSRIKRMAAGILAIIVAAYTLSGLIDNSWAKPDYGTILGFERVSPAYTEYVEVGTTKEELHLPSTLRAVCEISEETVDSDAEIEVSGFQQTAPIPGADGDYDYDGYGYVSPENEEELREAGELVIYTIYYADGNEAYRVYGTYNDKNESFYACDKDGNISGIVEDVPVTWNGEYEAEETDTYIFTAEIENRSFNGVLPTAEITVQAKSGDVDAGCTCLEGTEGHTSEACPYYVSASDDELASGGSDAASVQSTSVQLYSGDGPAPGTQAYYDARFEEAKEKAGWVNAGASYVSAAGGGVITNAGPWKYTGLTAANCSNPWNGNAAGSVPATGAGTVANPYQISTAEQFRYCVANQKSFKLMRDIDLGGYLGRNWTTPTISSTTAWTADGNGFTVYNYYMNVSVTTNNNPHSMFGAANNVTIKNLRVSNSYAYEYCSTSAFGFALLISSASNHKIDSCAFENNVVYKTGSAWGAAIIDNLGTNVTISNSYTNNCHVYVSSSQRGSCGALVQHGGTNPTITNSFAINGTVIGNKGHNGGFATCNYGSTIKNSFADIDVYGNQDAGAFIGVQHEGTHTIENCFGTGKVEGTNGLGGFIGAPDATSSAITTNIKQSYSSSMVGMMSNAQRQGSFIGTFRGVTNNATNPIDYTFTDCYGVGEVGGLDTNVSANRGTDSNTTGGFIGEYSGSTSTMKYSNCYYDKQTTAMREWALGVTSGSGYNSTASANRGVKGVLTTDTDKSGTGLTSSPSSNGTGNQSFTGFSDNSGWVFKDEYYPQLKVFTNPTTFTNTNWMSQTVMNNLVKAYSQASVSTVELETYDKDYAGNSLPFTTYDTVRDLTQRFPLTSDSNIAWKRVGSSDNLPNGSGNATSLYNQPYDILKLSPEDGSYGGNYYGYDFAPGIEWLRVSAKVGDQIGHRQLRIIPTMNIEAGYSTIISPGQYYNHAQDMRMTYSTGARMEANKTDFTYGVYPDNPLDSAQAALLSQSKYPGVPSSVSSDNDKYFNVNALYMERSGGTLLNPTVPTPATSAGGKINEVVIRRVSGTNTDGSLELSPVKLDMTQPYNAGQWNGTTGHPFTSAQTGDKYVVTYYWSLADGRYMDDSKVIFVDDTTHTVSIEAQVPDGIRNSNYAQLDAYDMSNSDGTVDTSVVPEFVTDSSVSPKGIDILENQPQTSPAATSWKTISSLWTTTKITIKFKPDDDRIPAGETTPKTVTLTGDQIPNENGAETTFSVDIPQIALRLNSNGNYEEYYTTVTQNYKVVRGANGVYTIQFTGIHSDGIYGAYIKDVNQNIEVIVVFSPPAVLDFSIATPDSEKYTGGDKSDLISKGEFVKRGVVSVQTGNADINPGTSNNIYDADTVAYNSQLKAVWLPDANYTNKNIYVTVGSSATQVYLKPDGGVYTTSDFAAGTEFKVLVDDITGWTGFSEQAVTWQDVTVEGRTVRQLVLPGATDRIHIDVSFRLSDTAFTITKTLAGPAEEKETFVFQVDYFENGTEPSSETIRTMYASITLEPGETSKTVKFAGMDIGWYAVTELDSNWRFKLDESKLTVDNPEAAIVADAKVTCYVDATKDIDYKFFNSRLDIPWANGKDSVTNHMPPVNQYE